MRVERLEPRPEAGERWAGVLEVGGDLVQAPLDLSVGLRQQTPAVARQLDPDPATIGRVMVAPGEAADDEPIDDAGHAGAADGQLLGQHGRRLRAAVEDSQDAVLGQGQIYRGEGELDLPGEPRYHPPWIRWCFVVHTIRVSNHLGKPNGKPNCPYCQAAREHLAAEAETLEERDARVTVACMARTAIEDASDLVVADVIHKRFSALAETATVREVREWFAGSPHRRMAFLCDAHGRYRGSAGLMRG